jgi:hypothetical protein
MGLFTGEDVEARPGLWRNPWVLALLVGDFPVDAAIGLITGMPRLEAALTETELAMPASTLLLIRLGHFLAVKWWLALPPLVIAPLLIAWRYRQRAVPGLQVAFVVEFILFLAICLVILLPIKTILDAS